jgi:hypothetical protein
VIFAKALAEKGYIIPKAIIREITNIPERVQTRILTSKQVRSLHNQDGIEPRGRKRCITRAQSATIADHLSDSEVELDDKSKPWQNIAEDVGKYSRTASRIKLT